MWDSSWRSNRSSTRPAAPGQSGPLPRHGARSADDARSEVVHQLLALLLVLLIGDEAFAVQLLQLAQLGDRLRLGVVAGGDVGGDQAAAGGFDEFAGGE